MVLFNDDSQFKVGTGNKLADMLLGGMTGFADATQSRGQYVPMFNWQGNGIARGGIQYLANPNYRDYASGGRMLGAALGAYGSEPQQDNQGYGNNSLFNTLGRLSALGGSIGNWAAEQRGKLLPNGKLKFENMFSRVGDFGNRFRPNPLTNDTIA